MANFARLDENNYVVQTIVICNDDIVDENGNESESMGIEICKELSGYPDDTWIQTSYNSRIRSKFASIGDRYIPDRDIFISSSPHDSWIFNEETLDWDPPVDYPSDYNDMCYFWDEESLSWKCFADI
jgi:hypothetical protein